MAPKKKTEAEEKPKESIPNTAIFDGMDDLMEIGEITIIREFAAFKGLPSGSLALDWAVGGGRGWPRGAYSTLSGVQSSGKTSISIMTAATAIKAGFKVVVINMEHRWNAEYALKSGMGIPGTDYILCSPPTQEDALNYLIYFCKHHVDLVIIDSVASMSPRQEFEGELEQGSYALQSRIFSQFFRMRMIEIEKSNTAIIFLNQLRQGMDVYEPTVHPGGKALAYYASVSIDLKKPPADDFEYLNAADKTAKRNPIGIAITGKTYKNIVTAPFREISIPIRFNNGLSVDTMSEIIQYGPEYGVFTGKSGGKPGHWYYKGEFLGESSATTKLALQEKFYEEPEFMDQIIREIRQGMIGS